MNGVKLHNNHYLRLKPSCTHLCVLHGKRGIHNSTRSRLHRVAPAWDRSLAVHVPSEMPGSLTGYIIASFILLNCSNQIVCGLVCFVHSLSTSKEAHTHTGVQLEHLHDFPLTTDGSPFSSSVGGLYWKDPLPPMETTWYCRDCMKRNTIIY